MTEENTELPLEGFRVGDLTRNAIAPQAARAPAEAMDEDGLSDLDWSSYITLIEKQADVEVRV